VYYVISQLNHHWCRSLTCLLAFTATSWFRSAKGWSCECAI